MDRKQAAMASSSSSAATLKAAAFFQDEGCFSLDNSGSHEVASTLLIDAGSYQRVSLFHHEDVCRQPLGSLVGSCAVRHEAFGKAIQNGGEIHSSIRFDMACKRV